jgi:hypothetical protein
MTKKQKRGEIYFLQAENKSVPFSAEQIYELRTAIAEVKFVNPTGHHGGKGSTKAHNEILKIIDNSKDYGEFRQGLNEWAGRRLEGGVDSLPSGLKN